MTNKSVADYYASLSVKINNASFLKAEQQLKKLEAQLKKYKMSFKGFDQLTIKPKFKVDSLDLQRQMQTSINKVNKLLSVEISRFHVDNMRLHKQLQSAFDRASQNIKLNVKTIGGQAGGAGIRPVFLQPHHMGGYGFGVGPNLNLPQLPGMGSTVLRAGGIAAAAAAGAAAYGAHRFSQNATQAGSEYKMMEAQFKSASGDKWQESLKRYQSLTNYLGLNTVGGSLDYTRSLQSLNDSKMQDSEQFLGSMLKFSKASGISEEQVKLVLKGIGQSMSKGQLYSEEWSGQVAEQLAGANKYGSMAWAKVVGADPESKTAAKDFKKAMADGKIAGDKLLKFFSILGSILDKESNRGGRLDVAIATPEAQKQRLENIRKSNWNAAATYNNGALIKSTSRLQQSYAKLNESMKPFYERTSVPASWAMERFADITDGVTSNITELDSVLKKIETSQNFKDLSAEWDKFSNNITDGAESLGFLNDELKEWNGDFLESTLAEIKSIIELANSLIEQVRLAKQDFLKTQVNGQTKAWGMNPSTSFAQRLGEKARPFFQENEKFTAHYWLAKWGDPFGGNRIADPKFNLPVNSIKYSTPLASDTSQFQMPNTSINTSGMKYGNNEASLSAVMEGMSTLLKTSQNSSTPSGPVTFQNTFNVNEASDAQAVADTVNRTLQSQFTDVLTAFPNQR